MTTLEAKDTLFKKKYTLNCRGKLLSLEVPLVMGILNLTPDSFYPGSRLSSAEEALQKATQLLSDGADILDIGGYSSRPGAADISVQEELERVVPAIETILQNFPEAVISVDTFRAEVAEASIAAGAAIINDISGGTLDEAMFETVARLQVPYVLMHMRGTPQTMTSLANYNDVVLEVVDELLVQLGKLQQLGVKDVIVDPGFGFAKTVAHNFELLRRLEELRILGHPILAGLSRKSMVYKSLGIDQADALTGTVAVNTVALMKGADILRVHDVKEAKQTIILLEKTQL
ncbi:Dihydropteroate synthase [Pontibacter akesuensis]|uniref:Dihydropteroate synthase n=1 Tax=Pontibacter akesuensis TaxID=388950 RepID=A0A1I7IC58_9BACT|nr:dihydropteroate synthase [Pontibacter akesuensis]GHA66345.1 dihydropteroate synthase [Pontibacter akesuensis]SFU70563.1 Dihydropteroate synthase [Pontibacter akesuensis]